MMCFEDSWVSLVWRSGSDNNEEGEDDDDDDVDVGKECVGVTSNLTGFEGSCCCDEVEGKETKGFCCWF